MLVVKEENMMEFIKILIELAGAYEVQKDRTIMNTASKKLATSECSGKRNLPIKIFKEGDTDRDVDYLQPFRETCVSKTARSWFYMVATGNVLHVFKQLLYTAIELAAKKSATDPDQLAVITKIAGKADEKMLAELDKIILRDLIMIEYNKTKKTAVLRANYLSADVREKYPKIRKQTWEVIDIMARTFLDDEELDEDTPVIEYTATLLNIPETEAKLQVIISTLVLLEPYYKLFIGGTLHASELCEHVKLLNGYHKLHAWLNADTPSAASPAQDPGFSPFGVPKAGFGAQAAQQPLIAKLPDEPPKPNVAPPLLSSLAEGTPSFAASVQQQQAPVLSGVSLAQQPQLGVMQPNQQMMNNIYNPMPTSGVSLANMGMGVSPYQQQPYSAYQQPGVAMQQTGQTLYGQPLQQNTNADLYSKPLGR